MTGVAGMIGSNTARALLEDGLSVVGVDNLWRGTRANIADLLSHVNFTFGHADLICDHDWYRNMGRGRFDPLGRYRSRHRICVLQ